MGNVYDTDPELKSLVGFFDDLANQNPTFDSFIDLKDESQDLDTACLKFKIRDDFIGNRIYRTLHGGLISAVLDTAGGAAVFFGLYKKIKGKPREVQITRVSKNATIDLRVDYLRPGLGSEFTAKAWILRIGSKVTVTRMELRNEEDVLIAVGTGTYAVG